EMICRWSGDQLGLAVEIHIRDQRDRWIAVVSLRAAERRAVCDEVSGGVINLRGNDDFRKPDSVEVGDRNASAKHRERMLLADPLQSAGVIIRHQMGVVYLLGDDFDETIAVDVPDRNRAEWSDLIGSSDREELMTIRTADGSERTTRP